MSKLSVRAELEGVSCDEWLEKGPGDCLENYSDKSVLAGNGPIPSTTPLAKNALYVILEPKISGQVKET